MYNILTRAHTKHPSALISRVNESTHLCIINAYYLRGYSNGIILNALRSNVSIHDKYYNL